MCNHFLYRKLISIVILIVLSLAANGQQDLYADRTMGDTEALDAGLYHQILHRAQFQSDVLPQYEMDRQQVISLLYTRYPELAYEIEHIPKQTLNNRDIANLMVDILKIEGPAGITNSDDTFWHLTKSSDLSKDDKATFQFLYGYELFKQKRFKESDKVFREVAKVRKGDFEYAFYYSGMIALLENNYAEAEDQLKHIGKVDLLKTQAPYYLAAAHYGQKDYHTVVKYYEPRIKEHHLFNQEGINQIVGFSQFKLEQFDKAIATLTHLEQIRDLKDEEKYVLGIAHQRTGAADLSTKYLAGVNIKEQNLDERAKYEEALNLADLGKNVEAITAFEQLLLNSQFDRNEIKWNLAILQGRKSNYDMVAHYSLQLLDTPKEKEAVELISKLLNNIENEQLFEKIALQLSKKLDDDQLVKNSIYNRATLALKEQKIERANHYFDLLVQLDPIVEERGTVAAWRGIMAYQNNNYSKAIRLLSNYQNSKAANVSSTALDFDAAYFLGYSHFKLKNHSGALGHFSKALSLQKSTSVNGTPDFQEKQDDLFLRLADCYFLLDEYKSAEQAYTRIIDSNGKMKDYALWQNSIIAELENRPYDQILTLDEIVSDHPASKYADRALFSSANALFGIQRFDKSSNYYKRLIASSAPTLLKEESKIQLGLIHVNAGDYKKAEEFFEGLIQTSKNTDIVSRSQLALREIYADYTNDTDAYLDLVSKENKNVSDNDLAQEVYNLAINNSEKGNDREAIDQWEKLIKDYPDYDQIEIVYNDLGDAYSRIQNWTKAISSYRLAGMRNNETGISALQKGEQIAYNETKDYTLFLEIRKQRTQGKDAPLSDRDKYMEAFALNELKQLNLDHPYHSTIFQSTALSKAEKQSLLTSQIGIAMKEKNYEGIIAFMETPAVKNIVDQQPKFIYQRSLILFNAEQLEAAEFAITDHYDALLADPAWLAKGIILVSDIYVLKDQKESAEAALEALIDSEAKIPASLINIAKERLKSLDLQN